MPPRPKPPTKTYASRRAAALRQSPVKQPRSISEEEDELASPPTAVKAPAKRRRFVPLPTAEETNGKRGRRAEKGEEKEKGEELMPPVTTTITTTTKAPVGRRRFVPEVENGKTAGRAKKGGAVEDEKLQETTTNARRSTRIKGATESQGNGRSMAEETEESLDELSRSSVVLNRRSRGGRSAKVVEKTKDVPMTTQKRKVKDVYDAPSSDDELSRPPPRPRTKTKPKLDVPRTTRSGRVKGKEGSEDAQVPAKKRARTVVSHAEEDEDVIAVNGKIAPAVPTVKTVPVAPPLTATAKKPRPTKSRPSLGTEGLKDPFVAGDDIDEPAPPPKVTKPAKPAQVIGDLNVSTEEVQELQRIVMAKLMGRAPVELVGLDDEYTAVHQLLSQTITAGEGNSLLLIGSRGSGKSALINAALTSLSSSHPGDFHLVRLSGLLQTDDKLALREIWRQLGLEMSLPETETAPTNFADTLASLLAMLSHPTELTGEAAEEGTTTTAVLFILDEFDLFTTHPRQTLLYNLFDIASSRKAPIAVIGSTAKLETLDSLEKRVKSRFSHRTLHIRLPATLDEYWAVVRAGLEAPPTTPYHERWNDHFLPSLRSSADFTHILKRAFAFSKTPAPVWNALLPSVAALSAAAPFPCGITGGTLAAPPSNIALLTSLSDVQTALLIAAARLEVLCDAETVGWEMVYDEYLSLCSKASIKGRVWGRQVARAGWEGLEGVGLVVPVRRGVGLWRVEVGLMEVRRELGGVAGWARWCKEIV